MLAHLDDVGAQRDAEIAAAAEARDIARAQSVKLRSHELYVLRRLIEHEEYAQTQQGPERRVLAEISDPALVVDTLRDLHRRLSEAYDASVGV
jgi:hypothetical protein